MNGMVTDFLIVADQIFILVLLIAAGYVAVSTKIVDPRATRGLSGLLINITIPALIVASMQVPFTPERLVGAETLILATGMLYVFSFALAWAVSKAMRVPAAEEGVLQFAIVFGNVGFMGFPVALTLFGEESLFYVAIFNLVFNVLVFSVGIAMLTEGRGKGFDPKLLLNPGIAASVVGLALFLGSVEIPSPFIDSIDLLGGVTTPLAMIIVGAMLATFPAREMVGDWRIWATSAVLLLAVPVAYCYLFSPVFSDPLVNGVMITMAAMPAAANTAIFAEQYGADARLASQIVFVSTIGSLVTIPLMTTVLL
ncbi:MAG: AEC family transporter [Methanoculleus sp.]|uniref:AEC family transporter n=1 Tax=unclassified Methanoculleus TaxID=2619537 RepID=UPI0025DD263A|nr:MULTISPECIES: AEC family transporter [unclassified Methanoculleus]MCK9317439.1 AEC family transporter [Methanoculleus sp.]MDD2254066.1 AEC family transporter [Methanoculleus sp.]MDD3215375.1 AEC family transporter [Methanoculleus sp.]MDD4314300.1 AEC family transporter [Methanoculleus sp.]MDD4470585.1 AEC family transporter [Methanoculleus sp.]